MSLGSSSATGSGGWIQPGRPDVHSVAAKATGSRGLDSARSGRDPDSVATTVEWVPVGRASAGRQRGSAGGFGRPAGFFGQKSGRFGNTERRRRELLAAPGGRRAASAAGRRDWLAAIAELRLPGLITSAASIPLITAASRGYGK